jgi:hypothetical protein
MRQKEARLDLVTDVANEATHHATTPLRSGDWGMGHGGRTGLTLDAFNATLLSQPGVAAPLSLINEYVQEFDTGVGPMVGHTISVVEDDIDTTPERDAVEAAIAEIEEQVKDANCGLAVYLRLDTGGGVLAERGYYYRLTGGPRYQQMFATATLQLDGLLDLLTTADELAVFTATPLGSDRRTASLTGSSTPPGNVHPVPPTPSGLAFVGSTPNAANMDLATSLIDANWDPNHATPGKRFVWNGIDPVRPASLLAVRLFQSRLMQMGVVSALRHEAPRRLQLTGTNLFEGAVLRLGIPQGDGSFANLVLPIFPTDAFHDPSGARIWETAAELDPLTLYALLFGGFAATGVQAVLAADDDGPGDGDEAAAIAGLAPSANAYRVAARNDGGSFGTNQLIPLVHPIAPVLP